MVWHMHEMGSGAWIYLIILAIVIIVAIILVTRWTMESDKRKANGTPLDILKKRYARGEMTRSEYEQMKKDIQD